MRHKACKTCLWWWDLHDTGEKSCHRRTSPFYQKPTVDGCTKHEDSVVELASARNGVPIERYMEKRKDEKR